MWTLSVILYEITCKVSVNIFYCPTSHMLADLFTKGLHELTGELTGVTNKPS